MSEFSNYFVCSKTISRHNLHLHLEWCPDNSMTGHQLDGNFPEDTFPTDSSPMHTYPKDSRPTGQEPDRTVT